jgi:hypothetical protein
LCLYNFFIIFINCLTDVSLEVSAYTEKDILSQLDDEAAILNFPALDNGYVYPADVRMSVFGDKSNWAIMIEQIGYNPRASAVTNTVFTYGTCVKNIGSATNIKLDVKEMKSEKEAIPPQDYREELHPDTKFWSVRYVMILVIY